MIKSLYKACKKSYRWFSADKRCVPQFLVVGAQKSGTTSLFYYLAKHPSIIMAYDQEVSYFDLNYQLGLRWYKIQFPTLNRVKDKIVGENTPNYLFYPTCPKRISELHPDMKIVMLLRNPVHRAYSQYWHEKKYGYENRDVWEAIVEEEDRVQENYHQLLLGEIDHSFEVYHFAYLKRGLYAEQIARYMEYFDRKSFCIVSTEEFSRDPHSTLDRIFHFLSINSHKPDISEPHNVNVYPRMPEELEKFLYSYYESPNDRLFKLIGQTFDW